MSSDRPQQIALLTGGSTPERPVALAGAGQVAAALRELGHQVTSVDTCEGPLSKEREAALFGSAVGISPPSLSELQELEQREDLQRLFELSEIARAELVFLVLHGRQGEGGSVQALLESRSLRYTGSDSFGSALAMDKDIAKKLLRQAGVPTPDWCVWPAESDAIRSLGMPVIVKPSRVGSTVGLSLVEQNDKIGSAVEEALTYDSDVLLERFLPGRELTVGVLGDLALGVGEIIPSGQIFDYHGKYTPGVVEEIFPADISVELASEIRDLALAVHRALKLRDFSRVDFRLDSGGTPYCLEANTLPGMTAMSLLPQSAAATGLDYQGLCQAIVDLAMER